MGIVSLIASRNALASYTSRDPLYKSIFAQGSASWSTGQGCTTNPIHVALLPNGKIFYLAGSGWNSYLQSGPYEARIVDLNSGSEKSLIQNEDLFCIGLTSLADGKVLLAGELSCMIQILITAMENGTV